jgi:carbonic anhydrase
MTVSAADALLRLQDGNARYVADRAERPNATSTRRIQLAGGQSPFAVVLACADSRVVPELIFDTGLGDLFVIRVAGNITDDAAVLGSIEYAIGHLDTQLVVVLGHQSCGAVGAAVVGDPTDDHIDELIAAIAPAVEKARGMEGDLHANAIVVNAKMVADELRTKEPVMARHVAKGVQVLPALYSFDTGEVSVL